MSTPNERPSIRSSSLNTRWWYSSHTRQVGSICGFSRQESKVILETCTHMRNLCVTALPKMPPPLRGVTMGKCLKNRVTKQWRMFELKHLKHELLIFAERCIYDVHAPDIGVTSLPKKCPRERRILRKKSLSTVGSRFLSVVGKLLFSWHVWKQGARRRTSTARYRKLTSCSSPNWDGQLGRSKACSRPQPTIRLFLW